MQAILRQVLKKIEPPKHEVEQTSKLASQINYFIKQKYGLEAKLMGSVARHTYLRGDKDLDVFVFFPTSVPRKQLEKKALQIGKSVFRKFKSKYVIEYAEHPYTKGKIGCFTVEIVPAYKIKNTKQLHSAVDRTPFHTEYVQNNLQNNDGVRLLKKFLKAIGCYGSDLKTLGFSGYLTELMIIKYKTFKDVLQAAQKWDYQQIIDSEQYYTPGQYHKLKKMFKDQPLIYIDPVDKKRNVAAVLSKEKLSTFIFYSREFFENPSMNFFFPKTVKLNKTKILKEVKKRGTSIIAIKFKRPKIIEDILYPQLRRFERALTKEMRDAGFIILDSWVFADKECGLGIELLTTKIPKYYIIKGPNIFNPPKHRDAFAKKYKKVWFIDDRLVAEVERKHRTLESFIRDFLKGSIKKLQLKGVPSNIAKSITKRYSVTDDIRKIKSEEFWKGLEKEKV